MKRQTGNAFLTFCALLALCFAVTPALSQVTGQAFEGFRQNSNDPIQIEADALQVQDGKNKATFKGRVKVRQGTSTITTDKLVVTYGRNNGGGQGDVERLDLTGNVVVTSGQNVATGDKGHYIVKTERAVLEGNVVVSQGESAATGCRLVANLQTNVAQLDSCGRRVKTIFKPGSNN